MLNLVTFIIGIIAIFFIARYNGSNKLFWILLISMMSGFVGGTIATNISGSKEVNAVITDGSTNDSSIIYSLNNILFNNKIKEDEFKVFNNKNSVDKSINYCMNNFVFSTKYFTLKKLKPPQRNCDYIDTS